ncbi:WD40/YVTN/BNR-like repeat-containing protein [Natrinema versiforme]|uniref:Photosynthesis system II assembly factor Ycf48/Hcf136-like domain-containing protein n=1 Tax=Natrinema versiforme JCM 10478 TaxID=1227496 RepID=L9Y6N3_9EURY|nr:hypothetical protein [Natrinema versiforme]ELY68543.1 hypothetical protein C489_07580 [Natrinema versiforme JCM 10478]
MATHDSRSGDGFAPFFRRYAKSWVHAVAAAGMTAFGTLTIVHRGFAVLALASYVVPPIALYLWQLSSDGTGGERTGEQTGSDGTSERADAAATETRATDAETAPREQADTGVGLEADTETEIADRTATEGSAETPDGTATAATPDSAATTANSGGGDADASKADGTAAERATEPAPSRDWRLVDVPTETTLRDISVTETGAVYAVGGGGLVLAADPVDGTAGDGSDGDWSIVLEDGPAAAGEDLAGVDATAAGEAVWVAGDSGSVGRLESETGIHTDYTAPADITDNWVGVAVAGASGDETVLLINGSGAVLRGRYRDGDCSWAEPVTPGSGSSLSGIALADASVGYCCDTNDCVFETTDGGESFEQVGLGDASGTLENLATLGRGDCLVSADDGIVHRYGGSTWTPERVGEEAVCGIARHEAETIACDADGVIYERAATGWEQVDASAPEPLMAVSVSPGGDRAVAVGEDGTVVERR